MFACLQKSTYFIIVFFFATVSAFPGESTVTISNCGMIQTYENVPRRVITMNQASLEIMLVLGLEDKVVGAAYLENPIYHKLQENFSKVKKILTRNSYPSKEVILSEEPDFIYATYPSAFSPKRGLSSRKELKDFGISSFLSPAHCSDKSLIPSPWTMTVTYNEIRDIARIFGVEERANDIIADMRFTIEDTRAQVGRVEKPLKVFWFDSNMDTPYAGTGGGAPEEIINLAGGVNIFSDVEGAWATVTWEEVVARNPDVIVLVNADWTSAAEKKKMLETDPRFTDIAAVRSDRFIEIDFVYTTEGPRNADAVRTVAMGLYPEKFEE
jgi:iron complex transport system substrate-binding protein